MLVWIKQLLSARAHLAEPRQSPPAKGIMYDILSTMRQHYRRGDFPHPRGLLFDMDGVLLLTSQSPSQSWREVARQFAPVLNLPAAALFQALLRSYRAYRHEIAHDLEKQRRDRLEPFETRLEVVEQALTVVQRVQEREMAVEIVRAYERLRETHRHLAPHALQVLGVCRQRSLALALLTNGNAAYQRRKIAQHGLAPWFDVILIEGEVGVAKPDPRIFRQALELLQLSASEAWMIGDDLACDIAGAQQVGLFAVWCDLTRRGLRGERTIEPDCILYDLAELYPLLTP